MPADPSQLPKLPFLRSWVLRTFVHKDTAASVAAAVNDLHPILLFTYQRAREVAIEEGLVADAHAIGLHAVVMVAVSSYDKVQAQP